MAYPKVLYMTGCQARSKLELNVVHELIYGVREGVRGVPYFCSRMGFGKTRSDVILLVENLLISHRGHCQVSNGWLEGFCRRHPRIRLRNPACVSKARAVATDTNVLEQYFDILEGILKDDDCFDKPYQFYNVDETGMPLDPKPMKIASKRGEKIQVLLQAERRASDCSRMYKCWKSDDPIHDYLEY
uniref:HTH CENPB-type domain-containing protein n=1 Tax=Amphimedon queenslandica TaxID=400682 RepID=A0A1X7V987_AMPQE